MLRLEPVEPDSRAPANELGPRELPEREKVCAVPMPEFLGAAGFLKSLEPELADRLQHPEALLHVANEALVDERVQHVQVGAADGLGGF